MAARSFLWICTLIGCSNGKLDLFEVEKGGGAAGNDAGAATSLLLDDFEDGDNAIAPDGWWYAKDDGTGPRATLSFEMISGREPSRVAAHVAAGPTSGFGSFLGLDLPGPIFDASGYSSLSFWARMEPPGELSVRFQSSQPVQYVLSAELDGTWREVRLPIADFRSINDGTPFDPTDVTHLQLWLADTRPAYELYVDDVWLLRDP